MVSKAELALAKQMHELETQFWSVVADQILDGTQEQQTAFDNAWNAVEKCGLQFEVPILAADMYFDGKKDIIKCVEQARESLLPF